MVRRNKDSQRLFHCWWYSVNSVNCFSQLVRVQVTATHRAFPTLYRLLYDFIQKEIKRLCASSSMRDETAIGASKATEEMLHRGLPMGWEVGTGVPGV